MGPDRYQSFVEVCRSCPVKWIEDWCQWLLDNLWLFAVEKLSDYQRLPRSDQKHRRDCEDSWITVRKPSGLSNSTGKAAIPWFEAIGVGTGLTDLPKCRRSETEVFHSQDFAESFFHYWTTGSKLRCNMPYQTESLLVQDFRSGLRNVTMPSPRLGRVTQVPPPTVAVANTLFQGICSIRVPPIGFEQLRVNILVSASYQAPINNRWPLHDDQNSNASPWNISEEWNLLLSVLSSLLKTITV
jgi:hypothetical protein